MSKAGSGGWGMGSGDRARRFARALATGQYQLGTGLVADRTVHDLIGEIAALLSQARIPDPRREATDIVAAVLDVPRLWPAVHRQELISQNSQSLALRASAHRAMGAPFAYSVGRAAFRHLNLEVDDRVLIPRQETEILVEAVLNHANTAGGLAVDIGTGSGAIALSLASEARFEQVVGTDISTGALAIARANASRVAPLLNSRVEFRHGSFLAPVAELRARVVVSNPPYVATAEAFSLPASVRDWEPPVALFSGGDGMVATERIIRDAACVLEPFGLLALEVDSRRAPLAARLAADTTQYHHITILPDLTGRDRILLATRTDR